jgi:hypothetical protein
MLECLAVNIHHMPNIFNSMNTHGMNVGNILLIASVAFTVVIANVADVVYVGNMHRTLFQHKEGCIELLNAH